MALHRLTSITMGVPNVEETAAYYDEFGLAPDGDGWFTTRDAGRQLRIVPAPTRRLIDLRVGVDDSDDLARAAGNLERMGIGVERGPGWISAVEQGDRRPALTWRSPAASSRTRSRRRRTTDPDVMNALTTGRRAFSAPTASCRASSATRCSAPPTTKRPRRSSSTGSASRSRPHQGAGTFMRCSTDHHNVLVLGAPVSFLHHTSWQVDDVDDVGRGASSMLEDHPERHIWGLGRHYGGSNFFWYLKDPAGNFSEYYSDMDCIVDDQLWTPQDLRGAQGLFSWGPPPPPSFLHPEDLAAMMTGAHSAG